MLSIASVFTHLLLFGTCVGFIVGVLYYGVNDSYSGTNYEYFNYHPICMVVATVFCASEAALMYRLFPGSHAIQKGIHFTLHTSAVALAATGVALIWKYHDENAIPNLYSAHSIMGLAAISIYGFQWLCGFFTYYNPFWNVAQKVRASGMPYHKYMGIVAIIGMYFACIAGLMDRQRIILDYYYGPVDQDEFAAESLYLNGLIIPLFACLAAMLWHFSAAGSRVKGDSNTDPLLVQNSH